MKFLILGCGSIGKRHLRNLLAVGVNVNNIIAVDPREDRLKEVKALGVNKFSQSYEKVIEENKIDAALICSPTNMHIKQGIDLAKKSINLFIEKPLDENNKNLKEFNSIVKEKNITVAIAYIFRFSPLTQKVKDILSKNTLGKVMYIRGEFSEYLPDFHPFEDYRSFYMAKKELGGGSILDQSHIMDLIGYLFGNFKEVYAVNTNLSSLEISTDDISEMIIHMESGSLASIHTDIFGRGHKKYVEVKAENGNILIDFLDNTVSIYNAESKSTEVFNKFPKDFNLNYIDEINNFISSCNKKAKVMTSLEEGVKTMNLILAAKKSQQTGKKEIVEV
mgnify:CR=1 FL=1